VSDLLKAAVWNAKRGFHAFPLDHPMLPKCIGVRTAEHDPDTCTERGKHPTVKWSTHATTDLQVIVADFAGRARNIGISCGPSGLLVVDEDVPGDFARFAESIGQKIPDQTFTVKTGKGFHYYLRQPEGKTLGNGEGALHNFGVNIRGAGGYVVGAGSRHATGLDYVAIDWDAETLLCPEWLVAALNGKAKPSSDSIWDEFAQPGDGWWRNGPIDESNRHKAIVSAAGWALSAGLRRDEAVPIIRDVLSRHTPAKYTLDQALGRLDDVYRRYEAGPRRDGTTTEKVEGRTVRLTAASSIVPRPVRWLWEDRLPVGEMALTPGRGGVGKSTFHAWAIAHLTRGTLPGSYWGTARACVIATTEDSWEHTIVPRLMAAGADLSLVHRADVITEAGAEMTLSLPRDVTGLTEQLMAVGAVLLSVDPLMSVIAGSLDTHKDRDVRQALEPLKRLAESGGVVVLGNAHFNKGSGSDPVSLVTGSAAFTNVVRAVLAFVRDEEAEAEEYVIGQAKNNLGRLDLPSLRYHIESAIVATPEGPASVGRLVMLGETDRTVADILGERGSPDEREERDEAARWLRSYLEDNGGEAPAVDVYRAGAKDGLSKDQLKRAKKKARVNSEKAAMDAGWMWRLDPEGSAKGAKSAGGAPPTPFAPFGEEPDRVEDVL
jgi:hypothetical protein